MKNIAEKLKEKKLKVTPQRLAIYHLLTQTDEHPRVETIFEKLHPNYPGLSLATVYKALDVFKKSGLVQELSVGMDSFRYDANCEDHPHFVCDVCHRVMDIDASPRLDNVREEAEEKLGLYIERQQIYFFGKCGNCIQE